LLVAAVSSGAAVSCGGDDFSSQSVPPDGAVDAGQADSAQEDATNEPAVTTCAIQTTLASCDDCINAKCLDSCQKCADNSSCQDIFNCVIAGCVTESGVPDPACAEDCVKAHPGGFASFGAFWSGLSPGCVTSNCGGACPF
jgi:hypothetical protein